jgi:hypothetical protein
MALRYALGVCVDSRVAAIAAQRAHRKQLIPLPLPLHLIWFNLIGFALKAAEIVPLANMKHFSFR